MINYVALLRDINVSGQKKILMAELREVLTKSGIENVQTYIQSGNIIFQSLETDKSTLALKIHNAIKLYFGFEVPVLVLTSLELKNIFDSSPFPKEKKENSYFVMLYSKADRNLVDDISELSYPNEEFKITDKAIYFYCSVGYGKAKLGNNFFERKLKVTATARNYKTMVKLLSLSADLIL